MFKTNETWDRRLGPLSFIFESQGPAKNLAWNRSSTNKCYIFINSKNTEYTHDVPHSVLGSKKSIHKQIEILILIELTLQWAEITINIINYIGCEKVTSAMGGKSQIREAVVVPRTG